MKASRAMAVTVIAFCSVCAAGAQQAPPAAAKKPATQKTQTTEAHRKPATAAKKPLVLSTQKQKASYAIGLNIGKNMKKDSVDVDTEVLARGMRDALTGSKPLLTDEEMKAALVELQTEIIRRKEKHFWPRIRRRTAS